MKIVENGNCGNRNCGKWRSSKKEIAKKMEIVEHENCGK